MGHDTSQDLRRDLLQPTLSTTRPPESIFSSSALFFTAFFGDSFAVILLSAANSKILGRLKADLWLYLVATVASLTFLVILVHTTVTEAPWLTELLGEHSRSATRFIHRGFALLVWAALYVPQRRYHQAAELSNLAPRSPWKAAIVCIAVSLLAKLVGVRIIRIALAVFSA